MGKRARRKQRAADLRKQAQAPKGPFVERKVSELREMDAEIQRLLEAK
jgi:hypothetical protein